MVPEEYLAVDMPMLTLGINDVQMYVVILLYKFNGYEHPMVQQYTQAKSDHKKYHLQSTNSERKRSSKVSKQCKENEELPKDQKFAWWIFDLGEHQYNLMVGSLQVQGEFMLPKMGFLEGLVHGPKRLLMYKSRPMALYTFNCYTRSVDLSVKFSTC